jgi:hypothetical protein
MARGKARMSAGGITVMIIVIIVVSMSSRSKQTSPAAPTASSRVTTPAGTSPTAPDHTTPAARPAARQARIGTWNIEWLGKPDQRSGAGRGVEQTTADLADYLVFSQVDALAVQEVIADAAAGVGPGRTPRSSRIDAMLAAMRQRTGQEWDYVLFRGRGDDDQLTGVLWNTRSVQANDQRGGPWDAGDEPKKLNVRTGRSSQGSGLWNRPPHAMRLRFGDSMTDIALVPLHMKADYDGAFAAHRAEEAAALVEVLPGFAREWSEKDVVMLGDTNVTAPGEAATATLVAAGFVDCNASDQQTHWRGGSMDRAFIPVGQPEFAGHTCEVVSEAYLQHRGWQPRDFKRTLSDHYMVVVTMNVMRDDD